MSANRLNTPSTLPQTDIVDLKTGKMTYPWQRMFQSLIKSVVPSFDSAANLQGNVGAEATVNNSGTLVGYLSQITPGGQVMPTGLPNPAVNALGGVKAALAAPHEWITSIDTTGTPVQAQPAFSDVSGLVAPTQLPTPTATTLGGVESIAPVAHEWVNSIGTDGGPTLTQPAFTDISGRITAAQLPAAGISVTIVTAALTTLGAQGSMTFVNGQLTASTPAT